MLWWSILFVLLAISLTIEIAYAIKTRRARFITGSIILTYAVALFSWIIFLNGTSYYLVRSGLFTAILLVALLCLHMIDIICCDVDKKL